VGAFEQGSGLQEGVKALGSYLAGAAGVSLCPLLDHQTALLHPNDRITCERHSIELQIVSNLNYRLRLGISGVCTLGIIQA
jgi:hypothetical protein